jgi:CRP-like cAMP-binding protein
MYGMSNAAIERPVGAPSGLGLRPHGAGNRSAPRARGEILKSQIVEPGTTIFGEGDDAEFFFEIVSGTVRCCSLTEDGRRQIYRFAGAGEMLGLSGEEVHSYSAEAVTKVTVRRRRLSSLDAEMEGDGVLRERVVRALRDELSAVRTQMMLLGRMSAVERIASFLRDLSTRATGSDGCIHLAMRRADIADYLGLTLETVSRQIGALKRSGVIELAGPCQVRIKDFDRLEAVAEAA